MRLTFQQRALGRRVLGGAVTRLATALALGASVFAFAPGAAAQVSDAALAESLFQEGKRLMDANRTSEACPKFAESYRLDPGLGTLLNLALCHEKEGKLASAWAEFSEALAQARRQGDGERAAFAEEHVRLVEPKLARVSLTLAPSASVPGLVIQLDGKEIAPAALGVPVPVDAGTHRVEASAPGKQPWSQAIQAPAEAATLSLTIPPLQDASSVPPAPPPSAAPAAPQPGAPVPPPAAAPAERESGSGANTGAIVSGIATGLFATGAIVTGVMYGSSKAEYDEANEEGDSDRHDLYAKTGNLGVANLVFVGGTAVAGTLFVIFLASGSKSEAASAAPSRQVSVLPALSPSSAGVWLTGRL